MHGLRVFLFFSRHWRVAGQRGAGGRYNFIRADDRRSITCLRGSVPAGKVNTDTLRAHRKRLLACWCICFTSHPRTNSHRSEHQLSRSGRTGECRGKGEMLRKEKEKKGMGRNVRKHKRSSGLTSDRLFCRVFPPPPPLPPSPHQTLQRSSLPSPFPFSPSLLANKRVLLRTHPEPLSQAPRANTHPRTGTRIDEGFWRAALPFSTLSHTCSASFRVCHSYI